MPGVAVCLDQAERPHLPDQSPGGDRELTHLLDQGLVLLEGELVHIDHDREPPVDGGGQLLEVLEAAPIGSPARHDHVEAEVRTQLMLEGLELVDGEVDAEQSGQLLALRGAEVHIDALIGRLVQGLQDLEEPLPLYLPQSVEDVHLDHTLADANEPELSDAGLGGTVKVDEQ